MKLGTLDWGIGGLALHRRLLDAGVADEAVYLSDAGFTPYGKLDEPALAARVAHGVATLRGEGCTHVALGCNAACTVLSHPRVRAATEGLAGLLGVVEPALRSVLALRPVDVVVLGGERTVASRVYARPLEAAGVEVRQRVAQPLSALVEAGTLDGPALDACLDAVCAPVADARVVVLACTHYPAVAPAITARFENLERLVDPAVEAAAAAVELWGEVAEPSRRTLAWTTGDPDASARAARAAFDYELCFSRI